MLEPIQKAVVDYATANIWCEPRQDLQVHVRPARISRYGGAYKTFNFLPAERYDLPDQTNRYHVYQIGQLTPMILGIIHHYEWKSFQTNPSSSELYSTPNTWQRISDVCQTQSMIIDLYIGAGLQFPRFDAYMMFTNSRNLLIAVKVQPKVEANFDHKAAGQKRLDLDQLMVHFYSNAYFESERAALLPKRIQTGGKVIINSSDIYNIHTDIDDLITNYGGGVIIHVNGNYFSHYIPNLIQLGDVVDWLWDASIKKIVDVPFGSEPLAFDSILDSMRKYFISYEPDPGLENIIDYKDDVDFYLVKPYDTYVKGRFFHRSRLFTTRMVTHRDYSVPVSAVEKFVTDTGYFDNTNELSMRLILRHSGYARPLTYEASKIHELYKMNYTDVVKAMIGLDATVDCWKVENLENSDYCRLMRTLYENVDLDVCQEAMGYNAISGLIGESPLKLDSLDHFNLPIGSAIKSAVFEYDEDGVLLDYRQLSASAITHPVDPDCVLIDALLGTISEDGQDVIYGNDDVPLEAGVGYRFYRTRKISGVIDEGYWEDVTDANDVHVTVDGTLVWAHDPDIWYGMVKSDKDVYVKSFTIDNVIDHLLQFTVGEYKVFDGTLQQRLMPVPPGRMEIWINGKALIPNLDYYCIWPRVVICNRSYLIDDEPQDVVIRLTGFCNTDLTFDKPQEYGFIFNNFLSRNNVFDIRDDHVIGLQIDGGIYHRSRAQFVEDTLPPFIMGFDNGIPYMVRDILVPIGAAITEDRTSFTMRQEAKVKDKQISDYLSVKIPEPTDPNPNLFPYRHSLFSPFISKIIHDFTANILDISDLYDVAYSDLAVKNKLVNYEWLLAYEPALLNEDGNYVEVRPHPHNYTMELYIKQYLFVERAIKLYCNNRIDLTPYMTVGPG